MSDSAKGFLAGVTLVLVVWLASSVFTTSSTNETVDATSSETSAVLDAPTKTVPTLAPTSNTTAPPTTRPRFSDLDTVTLNDLPTEARNTIALIIDGGPYPFSKDDSVFQNREGILPDHPRGYYREYTVITPGSSDRGARRVVAGDDGEFYYTQDHYASFSEVLL